MTAQPYTSAGIALEPTPGHEDHAFCLLTTPEVADQLRVSTRTVRRWCATGVLHAFKFNDLRNEHWRVILEPAD